MIGVRLKQVRKSFGAPDVIKGIELDVAPPGVLCVRRPVGLRQVHPPSRMIDGLKEISDFELFIGDKLMNDVDASRHGIAMVFQSDALHARQGRADVLTIATGGARGLEPGQRLTAHFDAEQVLLFDTDGKRIR